VTIDLIVRGVCCLRPGVPGVSENIRVRSIVGRFLEHSRVFYFLADGEQKLWCASADWMQRNFFRRVETCFPIEDTRVRERVFAEGLEIYLNDNSQAWILSADGKYKRLKPGKEKPRAAQEILLERLCGLAKAPLETDALETQGVLLQVRPPDAVRLQPPAPMLEPTPKAASAKPKRDKGRPPAKPVGLAEELDEQEPTRRAQ
jgi:hypothetical protein